MNNKISKIQIDQVQEYFKSLEFEVENGSKSEHTLRAYAGAVSRFFEKTGIKTFEDIEKVNLKTMRDYRYSFKGVTVSTINSNFRYIHAFFKFLTDNEYVTSNPLGKLKRLKEPKTIKETLTDEECDAIIDACENEYEKVLVIMMLATGARRSEITKAKVEDIRDHSIILDGKGKKEREVPLQDSVYQYLLEYVKNREKKNEYIFISEKGNHSISEETVRSRIKKILKNAGIDEKRLAKLSCHTFRRTFATSLLETVDSLVIQTALGHASITTTRKYAQTRNANMKSEILKNQRTIML
jgi:integrase/recombinase XerD